MLQDSFNFYYKATRLKDMLRQGAVQWNVSKDRLESIAEHTFGCMILAISLKSELKVDVNLDRVLEMLTIHELEELSIGDVTPLDDIDKKTLKLKARQAVSEMVSPLKRGDKLLALTDEYNAAETPDAKFAKAVDKLECVLEFKKYQDLGQVSLEHLTEPMLKNKLLKAYVDSGKYDLADIFFLFHSPAFREYGINEEYWFKHLKPLAVEPEKQVVKTNSPALKKR